MWKEQLVAEDLAMLFDAFEVDLEQELATPGCSSGGGFPQEKLADDREKYVGKIWGKCGENMKLLGKM